MLTRTQPTTLLEIFCKIIIDSKGIVLKYCRSRLQYLDYVLSINRLI